MAKKKRKAGKKRSGRRMGKISNPFKGINPILMTVIGSRMGDVFNAFALNQVAKMKTAPSPWIIAGGQGLIGLLAMTKSRNPFVQGVGVSFLFNGAMTALAQTGVLKGIGRPGYKLPLNSNGNGSSKELPIINGQKHMGQRPDWKSVLSGVGMI